MSDRMTDFLRFQEFLRNNDQVIKEEKEEEMPDTETMPFNNNDWKIFQNK